MKPITDEEFAALADKYSGKRLARADLSNVGTLVFRQPTKSEYRLFKGMILDPSTQGQAYDDLFIRTIVYPEPAAALTLTESWPGLTSNRKVILALNKLSGSEDVEEGKG